MLRIITTVGTSLFDNYFEKNPNSPLRKSFNIFNQYPISRWKDNEKKIEKFRKIKFTSHKFNISAETQCIKHIVEREKVDVEVLLLATDTITSFLAAEFICEWIGKHSIVYDPSNPSTSYDIKVISTINFIPSLGTHPPLGIQKTKKDYYDNGLQNLVKN